MKTEMVRITLFFEKSGEVVRAGRFTRNPSGGGWRLDDQLAVFPMAVFSSNPRDALEQCTRDDVSHGREKTVVNKGFLAKHDEISVMLQSNGHIQLIPMRRKSDGVSAMQATDAPIVVAPSIGAQEMMRELTRALALARSSDT